MENELEHHLHTILNDPSAMQNILTMARSLSGPSGASQEKAKDDIPVRQLAEIAAKSSIDQQENSLLSALSPYLSRDRLKKLENAMRAAKMAKLAATLISAGR